MDIIERTRIKGSLAAEIKAKEHWFNRQYSKKVNIEPVVYKSKPAFCPELDQEVRAFVEDRRNDPGSK